jgi:hypothetical protein
MSTTWMPQPQSQFVENNPQFKFPQYRDDESLQVTAMNPYHNLQFRELQSMIDMNASLMNPMNLYENA